MRPEFLATWLGIFGGLLNSTSGDTNDFADFAPSNEHFQNLSFFVSTASLLLIPNITLGGGRQRTARDSGSRRRLGRRPRAPLRFLACLGLSRLTNGSARCVVVVQNAPDLADRQRMGLGRVPDRTTRSDATPSRCPSPRPTPGRGS